MEEDKLSYNSLLINTCDLIFHNYVAKYTDPSEAVVPNVKCRIMYGNRLVLNDKGEEVRSFAKVFFLKNQTLDNAVFIRLNGTKHRIIKHSKHQNSIAMHHQEIYIE